MQQAAANVSLVSIGMPVLNAESTIQRALTDLVEQTYQRIEIVVCDNASTDRTAAVADEFSQRDARIRVVRFKERVDVLQSFQRAFEQCSGSYFMFAPADDRWYPRFIEMAVSILDSNPGVAACCGRVAFTEGGYFAAISVGTRPLAGSHGRRLRSYFSEPADNARSLGLYRRRALIGAFPTRWQPGWDYALVAATLAHGDQYELPVVLQERERTPDQKYLADYDRYYDGRRSMRWLRWLPLAPMAGAFWKRPTTPLDLGLLWNLMVFVLRSHEFYAVRRSSRWGPVVAGLARRVRLERWAVNSTSRADRAPKGEQGS